MSEYCENVAIATEATWNATIMDCFMNWDKDKDTIPIVMFEVEIEDGK